MRTEVDIYLIDAALREPVAALLIEEVSDDELREADLLWSPLLNQLNLEHSHWRWERKVRRPEPTRRIYGIRCPNQMQGLMIVKEKRGRLNLQLDVPLIYVDYISAAPWNLRHPRTRAWELADWDGARFLGCGEVLIRRAIAHSLEAGYEGRIGLHALPQAEQFYVRLGMTDLGLDEHYDDLRYYEMTPEQALTFSRGQV